MKKPTKEQAQEFVSLPPELLSKLIRSERPEGMDFDKYKEYMRTMKMLTKIQLSGVYHKAKPEIIQTT